MCYKFTYDAEVEYDLSTFASFISEDLDRHHGLVTGSTTILPSQPSLVATEPLRSERYRERCHHEWCLTPETETPKTEWCQTPEPARSLQACPMQWGFTGTDGRLLINARSETVTQKPTFVESFAERRCIIPAHAFFERNFSKEEVRFEMPEHCILYMAGIYRKEQGRYRFTVLTTEPHPSLKKIHDRVPLLLARDQIEPWIRDPRVASELLTIPAPQLITYQDYEQLTLL